MLKGLSDNNDNIQDKLQRLKIKEKSAALNEIDEVLSSHLKDVANLDRKVGQYINAFDMIVGEGKVHTRKKEIEELERRLG